MTEAERLARLELQMETALKSIEKLEGRLDDVIKEMQNVSSEIRQAMANQATKLTRPMDRLEGIKLGLVGLGSIVLFLITCVGGVLGILAYFKTGH